MQKCRGVSSKWHSLENCLIKMKEKQNAQSSGWSLSEYLETLIPIDALCVTFYITFYKPSSTQINLSVD